MSLLDCAVAVTGNQAMNYLTTGEAPGRIGNFHPNLAPYQVFDCSDGYIIIAVGNDAQYQRLCAALGAPDLATAPEYATNADRVALRDQLSALLTARTMTFTKEGLLSACESAGVPAGPINTLEEVYADPQIIARGMRIDPEGVPGVRTPIRFSDADMALEKASPKLPKS
jgi:crotonobetainyl-CoA:carnitine CoA-transferase CaiB-like acyl-CoA transferase